MSNVKTTYSAILDYIDGYEFRFDNGGGHTPDENERAMLEDFAMGLVADAGVIAALCGVPAPAVLLDRDTRK